MDMEELEYVVKRHFNIHPDEEVNSIEEILIGASKSWKGDSLIHVLAGLSGILARYIDEHKDDKKQGRIDGLNEEPTEEMIRAGKKRAFNNRRVELEHELIDKASELMDFMAHAESCRINIPDTDKFIYIGPVEPTEEMIKAAFHESYNRYHETDEERFTAIYKAMTAQAI